MTRLHRINIEPGGRSRKLCIRGLRMIVADVPACLASGTSVEELHRDFPDRTRKEIRTCLAFAADRGR